MRKTLASLAVALVIVLIAVVWIARHHWQRYLTTPLALDATEVQYIVAPGASLGAVALALEAKGWLQRPRWFVWYARLRGDASRIRAGEYAISAETTPASLLDLLISGEEIQHAFTIIEGSKFSDIRLSLSRAPTIKQTIDGLDAKQIMAALARPETPAEGRFLPETYYYTRGTSDLVILKRAAEMMDDALAELWPGRSADAQVETPEQALILASIIEKETALDTERKLISGVFTRRLKKGMRLQSDPTVIYGLGAEYDGNIRRRDLTGDTPYNTYTRAGLPPTPIAMPGRASIAAALQPAPGDALYFVASGDPSGSHYFSATLEEHNEAVQRYLVRLRQKK